MNSEQYDQLLVEIRKARRGAEACRKQAAQWDKRLDDLLTELGTEEHRLAQQALNHTPIASRKLVVGE